jgi:hypothetical protein
MAREKDWSAIIFCNAAPEIPKEQMTHQDFCEAWTQRRVRGNPGAPETEQ